MSGLDRIINPIPEDEKLKEAIHSLLDKLLALYYLRTTDDGEPLDKSFEKLKKGARGHDMIIITGDREYTINLEKYVEKKGLGGILKQAINLGRPYNIMQPRYKNYDPIGVVLDERDYLKRLIEEYNKKYGLGDKIIGITIVYDIKTIQL